MSSIKLPVLVVIGLTYVMSGSLFLGCGDEAPGSCSGRLCITDGGVDFGGSQIDGQVPTDARAPVDAQAVPDSSAPYVHEDISVQQLDQWIQAGMALTLLDVRETGEYQTGHIAGTINKPWNSQVLQADYAQLPTDKPIVVVCQSGSRSNMAAQFLTGKGFQPVYDMLGGMSSWVAAGLEVVQ